MAKAQAVDTAKAKVAEQAKAVSLLQKHSQEEVRTGSEERH